MATINFKAAYGKDHAGKIDKRDIRCPCGGDVACGGTIHPLVDLGVGFKGRKFVIEKKYSKRVIGYTGFCFKCKREGSFILPEYHEHAEAMSGKPLVSA